MTAPRSPQITVYPPVPPKPAQASPPVVVDITAEVATEEVVWEEAATEVAAMGSATTGSAVMGTAAMGTAAMGVAITESAAMGTAATGVAITENAAMGAVTTEGAATEGTAAGVAITEGAATGVRATETARQGLEREGTAASIVPEVKPKRKKRRSKTVKASKTPESSTLSSEMETPTPMDALPTATEDLPSTDPANPPQLRPYQLELVEALREKVREGFKRIVIIAGTGAGKTVIGGHICALAESTGSKLLFLVHLDVLVGQTYAKMQAFGLHCGFIKAGWPEDPSAPIQIASVQTMAKRGWWREWPADLIFYDEGHTTAFSQVGQEVLYQTHPNAVHIAMTATPYRLGDEQLGDHFETFVAAPPPVVLQQMGFLAPMQYYGLALEDQIDLQGVQTVAGDYDEKGLKNVCDRPDLVQRIVQEWQRLVPGKRSIAFCIDVEHARHVAAAFQGAGVTAEAVDGGTPPKVRQKLYQALAKGDLLVLTSCNVISIGFDVPAVEVGLLLRPTLSLALHHQQIGRVMRISPETGKSHGIILDQAGNLQRLGFPEDVLRYELPVGGMPSQGLSQGMPEGKPSKMCPQCQRCVAMVSMLCPGCGFDWAADRPVYTEDLIQLLTREQVRQIEDEPTRYRFFQGLRRYFFRRNYGPGLVKQEYFDYFGVFPPEEWYQGSIFGKVPSGYDRQVYFEYLQATAYRLGKGQDWLVAEFEREFGPGSWSQG